MDENNELKNQQEELLRQVKEESENPNKDVDPIDNNVTSSNESNSTDDSSKVYEASYVGPEENIVNDSDGHSNALAITSMVSGIISVIGCCFHKIALILGILAIVFSIVGKKRANETGKKMAISGLVCGIIGIILSTLVFIVIIVLGGAIFGLTMDTFKELPEMIQQFELNV